MRRSLSQSDALGTNMVFGMVSVKLFNGKLLGRCELQILFLIAYI